MVRFSPSGAASSAPIAALRGRSMKASFSGSLSCRGAIA
jgi:hypothetical protein